MLVSLFARPVLADKSILSPSNTEHKTRITYELVRPGEIDAANPQTAIVRFRLINPSDKLVSFDYKLVPGSFRISNIVCEEAGGITFAIGETEKELEIELKPWAHKPTVTGQASDFDDFWSGERLFFIYCNNIENALFSEGKRSETIAVPIENSFDYVSAYENACGYQFDLADLENVEKLSDWKYRNINNEISLPMDIKNDVRTMIDMGVFSHIELPSGKLVHQGENVVSVNLSASKIYPFGSYMSFGPRELEFDNSMASFGGQPMLHELGLGGNMEGNGVSTGLVFTLNYSDVTEAVYTQFDSSQQIQFLDEETPKINEVNIPYEVFLGISLGDKVPLIVKYTEPVYTDNICINMDGEDFYPLEKKGTISESVTILYEIDEDLYAKGSLDTNKMAISGARDLSGKEQEEETIYNSITFAHNPMNIRDEFFYCAQPSVIIEEGIDHQLTGTISISLKKHMDLSDWLADSITGSENLVSVVKAKVLGEKGAITEVPLYAVIEGGYITKLTGQFPITKIDDDKSYMVEIYLKDSAEFGLVYGLVAEYGVNPNPVQGPSVKAKINKPESLYITDAADHFSISFDIENKSFATQYILTVKRNKEKTPIFSTNAMGDLNQNHDIPISTVSPISLLDIYTVSLEAWDEGDKTRFFDSYMMYVYNKKALKILVNGSLTEELIIEPAYTFSAMTNSEIINKFSHNRGMDFTNKLSQLSIDNNSYNWSNIADKISWEVGAGDNLIIKSGSDIIEDKTRLFLPKTSLTLEAVKAGINTVTVTHHSTCMKTTLPVTIVAKPTDKLYIFYAHPQTKCRVTYTNGNNIAKTTETDDLGRLGIYEASGIKSDVIFNPLVKADSFSAATLAYAELVANQNSSPSFGSYPSNTVKLTPLGKYNVNLSLYDNEGITLTENIIIRGGVYINGEYNRNTTINGRKANADQTVSVVNGSYHLAFNPLEFINDKGQTSPDNKIEYIIEISTPDNKYYPLIVELTDGEIRNPDNSPTGIHITRKIHRTNPNSLQNNLIVSAQTLTIDGRKYNFGDKIVGIGQDFTKATVTMDLIFPNAQNVDYDVNLLDKKGTYWGDYTWVKPVNMYPFSRTGALQVSFDISYAIKHFFNNQIAKADSVHLYPIIRNMATGSEIKLAKPLILQNLFLPSMGDPNNWENGMKDLTDKIREAISDSGNYSSIGANGEVKEILDFLSHFNAGFGSMGMEIIPTDDPLVYKGRIRFSLGSYARDNPSGLFVTSGESLSYNFLPGFSEAKAMSKGEYLKQSKKAMEEAQLGSWGKTYGGGTFMDCQIFWNKDKNKWDLRMLKSDTYVGGGVHYSRIHNTTIGGFPVTAEFKTGVTSEVGLKTIYDNLNGSTAYITELRPNGYVYGFGGAGFDLKAAAVKAGPYGQINHEQKFLWYDYQDIAKNGQRLAISGSTGVTFKLQFLVFSVNGKYELLSAGDSWTYNNFDEIDKVFTNGEIIRIKSRYYQAADEEASKSLSFEDRSYLAHNQRSWANVGKSRMRGLSGHSADEPQTILDNAYPFSNPLLSEDGKMMVYMHDMNSNLLKDTAVNFSIRDKIEETFAPGSEISAADYPDINAAIAGTKDKAVVAWTRIFTDIGPASGSATNADISQVLDATEIMASVFNPDSGNFTTQQLTNNSSPDISPVVAASGSKAIVAWRSLAKESGDNPLDFSGPDEILYSTYDGTAWTGPKILYDGSIEPVEDFRAAMLNDGTAAIIYQVKKAGASSEMLITLVDSDGKIKNNLRLTNDDISDNNPQITALKLQDSEEGFLVGWHRENSIRLLALDGEGNIYPELGTEISNPAATINYANFRFAQGAENIGDLSLVWAEPDVNVAEPIAGIYKDRLWGIKLIQDTDGSISHSSQIKLLELDPENTADFYDLVAKPENNELHWIMLVTDHSNGGEQANLLMAKSSYKNEIKVSDPDYLWADIIPGMTMPIAFKIENAGLEAIDKITVDLGGASQVFAEVIKPGMAKEIVVFYTIPDIISNVDYTITANFPHFNVPKSGSLKLDLVDIAIDKISITKEEKRERAFNILLSNKSFAPLLEGTHTVKLGLYNRPDFETGSPLVEMTITDAERLGLMNEGGLSLDILLDEEDLGKFLNVKGEIPSSGAPVFFNAALLENGEITEDAEIGNNMDYVIIHSLAEKAGQPISIATMLQNTAGKSSVKIEAFNNCLNKFTNGNLVATLKDENGAILEKQASYNPHNPSGSAISIPGEDTYATSLTFNQKGASVEVIAIKIDENHPANPENPDKQPNQGARDYGNEKTGEDKVSTLNIHINGLPQSVLVKNIDGKILIKWALAEEVSVEADENIEIAIPELRGATSYTVELPVSLMASSDQGKIILKTHLGSIIIPRNLLYQLPESQGRFAKITLELADKSLLPEDTRAAIGARPFISYLIMVDDIELNLHNKKVAMIIPYILADDERLNGESMVIGNIDAEGNLRIVTNGFYNPASATMVFHTNNFGAYAIIYNPVEFNDVKNTHWFEKAVKLIAARNITSGTGEGNFSPRNNLTRGQFITLIMQAYGIPADKKAGENFIDAGNTYYSDYLATAKSLGIAAGVGDNRFAPENNISRQEMFLLLYKVLNVTNNLPEGSRSLKVADFTDRELIEPWAREAITLLVEKGIINGSAGKIHPTQHTSRAEMAQVIFNLLTKK